MKNNFTRFNFLDYPQLTFEAPDTKTFRNLTLAFRALEKGGNAPCVLNAANEVVVAAFLEDKVGFLQMSDLIEQCMDEVKFIAQPELEDYVESDEKARTITKRIIETL